MRPHDLAERTGAQPTVLVLVGLPGAGKTTAAEALSLQLGWKHLDLDREIEHREGRTVAEIFAADGESAFRALERDVTRDIAIRANGSAGSASGLVMAAGGGWMANREAVAHLRPHARIIYLRVSPEIALARLGRGIADRPLLKGDALGALTLLLEKRRPVYESADAVLDVEMLDLQQVTSKLYVLATDFSAR